MFFKVNDEIVALREQPDDAAPHPAGTAVFGDRLMKLADGAKGDWIRVRLVGSAPPREGFVHQTSMVQDLPSPGIDLDRFCIAVRLAARQFESNPYYLYALAFAASGITNTPDPDPNATGFGPYRFTVERWSALVGDFGKRTGLSDDDREDPFEQVSLAALDAHTASAKFQTMLGRPPKASELFTVFLLGDVAGSGIVKAAADGIPAPVDQLLTNTVAPADVAALTGRHTNILAPGGHPATAAEALAVAAAALQPGLDRAADAAGKLDPPYEDAEVAGPAAADKAKFSPAPDAKTLATVKPHAQTALSVLMQAGWSHSQACGIIANIQAESGFQIDAVGDGKLAYGICQWHPDRQQAFAKQFGRSIVGSSLEQQLAFISFEMKFGTETSAGKTLAQQTTPDAAGWVVARFYERPASAAEWSRRAGIAVSFSTLLA